MRRRHGRSHPFDFALPDWLQGQLLLYHIGSMKVKQSFVWVSIPEFSANLPEFPAKYQNFPQNQ